MSRFIRSSDWARIVNGVTETDELESIRASVRRGRPYGSSKWVEQTAKRLGLGFTLRPRGRSAREKTSK
jgi:putative transposase